MHIIVKSGGGGSLLPPEELHHALRPSGINPVPLLVYADLRPWSFLHILHIYKLFCCFVVKIMSRELRFPFQCLQSFVYVISSF